MPEKVSLRQVLVATMAEAREVRRKLGSDPRTFDSVARAVSKGPEATVGGYMGTFERGQLPPELEQAAFTLPERGHQRTRSRARSVIMSCGSSPASKPAKSPSRRRESGSATRSSVTSGRRLSGPSWQMSWLGPR